MQDTNEFLLPTSLSTYLSASTHPHQVSAAGDRIPHEHDHVFIDDSTDSYFVDTDTEDVSMSADDIMARQQTPYVEKSPSMISVLRKTIEAQNKKETLECDVSPQEELKSLMRDVKNDQPPECVVDILRNDAPVLKIIEEPEMTYRARYESEGCKGPIHGTTETGYPTIQMEGYVGEVTITVSVVTSDNEPHLHAATGPGSSKIPCSEVKLANRSQAIRMTMLPKDENDEMKVVFDQLSIRRVRNWEADRELRERGIEPASWKTKKKVAKLMFEARIPSTNIHPSYVLTSYSRSFQCTAPSGNPEIHWHSLNESMPEGGVEMGFLGKKFAGVCKVRFFSKEDDGRTWEACAVVDKTKSSLYGCVFKVPPYSRTSLANNVQVHVEIRAGPEKEPRISDPILFTYLATTQEDCKKCRYVKGFIQAIHSVYSGNELNAVIKDFEGVIDSNPSSGETHVQGKEIKPENDLSPVSKSCNLKPLNVANHHNFTSDLRRLLREPKTSRNSGDLKSQAMEIDTPRFYTQTTPTSAISSGIAHVPLPPGLLMTTVNNYTTAFQSKRVQAARMSSAPYYYETARQRTSVVQNKEALQKGNPEVHSKDILASIRSQMQSLPAGPINGTLLSSVLNGNSSPLPVQSAFQSTAMAQVETEIERQISNHMQEVKNLQKQLLIKQSLQFASNLSSTSQILPQTSQPVQQTLAQTAFPVQPATFPPNYPSSINSSIFANQSFAPVQSTQQTNGISVTPQRQYQPEQIISLPSSFQASQIPTQQQVFASQLSQHIVTPRQPQQVAMQQPPMNIAQPASIQQPPAQHALTPLPINHQVQPQQQASQQQDIAPVTPHLAPQTPITLQQQLTPQTLTPQALTPQALTPQALTPQALTPQAQQMIPQPLTAQTLPPQQPPLVAQQTPPAQQLQQEQVAQHVAAQQQQLQQQQQLLQQQTILNDLIQRSQALESTSWAEQRTINSKMEYYQPHVEGQAFIDSLQQFTNNNSPPFTTPPLTPSSGNLLMPSTIQSSLIQASCANSSFENAVLNTIQKEEASSQHGW